MRWEAWWEKKNSKNKSLKTNPKTPGTRQVGCAGGEEKGAGRQERTNRRRGAGQVEKLQVGLRRCEHAARQCAQVSEHRE